MNSLYVQIKRIMGDIFGMIGRWLIGNYKEVCKLTWAYLAALLCH
jgi:hypothetical protein